METIDIAIIGAGISGLFLGSKLKDSSHRFVIFEKSKGLGGRIATRRIQELGFDHGASYLQDTGPIRSLLKTHNLDPIVTSQGLYLESGMTHLPKVIAKDLPVVKGKRLVKLRQQIKWHLTFEDNTEMIAEKVILTAPLPQALELLSAAEISYSAELNKVHYTKAILALIITKGNIKASVAQDELYSFISMKNRGLHPHGFVLRASDEFSEEHFDKPDEEVLSFFRSFFDYTEHIELKKWRYALPRKTLPHSYLEAAPNLYLIGDYFGYPDIRGSLLSAEALAKILI